MNTEDNAPSAKILLNKFGNFSAILTISALFEVPKTEAINISLINPVIRDSKVPIPTNIPDLNSDISGCAKKVTKNILHNTTFIVWII